MQKEKDNWYSSWFNTPYYHILYNKRNYDEAGLFMTKLTKYLDLSKNASILDLACGKGRHSVFLGTLGYDVTGVDLSPASIKEAKKYESDNVHFKVHDMCLPLDEKYNAVLNLFTSFGYFDKEEDNFRTIQAIAQELKPDGHGVIDFLNAPYVIQHLVPQETKTIDGIIFKIKREVVDGYILKHIDFSANETSYSYTEKVKALTLEDFTAYFNKAALKITACFGNYNLDSYDQVHSERLILVFNKL